MSKVAQLLTTLTPPPLSLAQCDAIERYRNVF